MIYNAFFEAVAGHPPFPYQSRLGASAWPDVLDVPTGLGKTAAVTVAWLYKRLQNDRETGLRLVYCLPMRTLVEQTSSVARGWTEAATPFFADQGVRAPSVHVLMGGDVDAEWEQAPERAAILVGTQDMLLSRALNRGYSMSRFKWPVHFALLNNDCLWVLDETQLIGVGVETSAQLDGFRRRLGAHRATRTLWMSATLGAGQMDTVDHPVPSTGWDRHVLDEEDLRLPVVQSRVAAAKPIERHTVGLDADSLGSYAEALAASVVAEHALRGGLTLVIANRVARAQAIYAALREHDGRTDENTALIHSRFRPIDRVRHEALLLGTSADRIVVATQAIEAGVDVSAVTLFTELAPWPSLVQRLGRCNRYGNDDVRAYWIDVDTSDSKAGLALPYSADELGRARDLLGELSASGGDAGPASLGGLTYEVPDVVRPVIRCRDILDLFDTTPDLCGNDLDVSRFVRDDGEPDVQVFWRAFDEDRPSDSLPEPDRSELCRVSIAAAQDYLQRLAKDRTRLASRSDEDRAHATRLRAWRWDPLQRAWTVVSRALPGQVLLLHSRAGGYDPHLGWTGDVRGSQPVPAVETEMGTPEPEAFDGDPATVATNGRWVRLGDHLGHVRDEAAGLAAATGFDEFRRDLATAGLWHDVGKAHEVFQRKLLDPVEERPELRPEGPGPWAKSPHRLRSPRSRPHFRHELASALAWLAVGTPADARSQDLIAYLIAAHHGKVRMSIRSLPGEATPEDARTLYARGVWSGDVLSSFAMPDGASFDGATLDLSLMEIGQGSWLERSLALRDAADLGPFRLALLETIVRVADWRASRKEQEGAYDA